MSLNLVRQIGGNTQWQTAIGVMGIAVTETEPGTPTGGLGYHLAPEHWGRGYASEALAGLIRMTRLLTRLPSLHAGVMPHNRASVRVLEKNGFLLTGSGLHTSPFRGTFEVEHFERRLRGLLAPTRAIPTTPTATASQPPEPRVS